MKMKKYIPIFLILLISIFMFGNTDTKAATIQGLAHYMSDAIPFSTGDTISGKVAYSGLDSRCYYRFTLNSNSVLSVKGTSASGNIYIKIYDGESNKIASTSAEGYSTWGYGTVDDMFSLNAGTYWVEIGRSSGEATDYNVTFSCLETETSSVKIAGTTNNTFEQALSVQVGNTLKGVATYRYHSISITGTSHYYKFTVPSKQTVVINGNAVDLSCTNRLWLTIYDASGDELVSGEAGSRGNYASYCDLGKVTLSAGTYYIGVKSPDGTLHYEIRTAYYVDKVTGVFASSSARGKLKAKWNKVTGAAGYEVQFCNKRKFNTGKIYTVNVGKKKRSCTQSGLKRGKKCYVRVRAYKKISGQKIYGAWSTVKGKKVKR